MDPLTLTELDEYEARVKEVERALKEDFEYFHLDPTQVLRVIAAARASIPRPISEEPMDGTVVERCPHCGYTEEDKRFHMDHYLCDAKSARGPIPKGGVS